MIKRSDKNKTPVKREEDIKSDHGLFFKQVTRKAKWLYFTWLRKFKNFYKMVSLTRPWKLGQNSVSDHLFRPQQELHCEKVCEANKKKKKKENNEVIWN